MLQVGGDDLSLESSHTGDVKTKCHAATFTKQGATGVGAIIRDQIGRVVGALMRRWSSILDPLIAECLAIREGLKGCTR